MGVPLHLGSECLHLIFSNGGASGVTAAIPAVAGQTAAIYRMILTCVGASNVTIQDTTAVALSQAFAFSASGGSITIDIPINGDPWWQSVAGRGISINSSGAVQVSADIWYLQRSALP
jgi:hypothetical protein